LISEARRLTHERTTIEGQRRNLLDALANGGPGANTIAQRIGERDDQLGRLQQRHGEVAGQLAALATDMVDEAAIREALRDFDGMWNELIPREKARVLRLLLEECPQRRRRGRSAAPVPRERHRGARHGDAHEEAGVTEVSFKVAFRTCKRRHRLPRRDRSRPAPPRWLRGSLSPTSSRRWFNAASYAT
jgi:hypothetical protein